MSCRDWRPSSDCTGAGDDALLPAINHAACPLAGRPSSLTLKTYATATATATAAAAAGRLSSADKR